MRWVSESVPVRGRASRRALRSGGGYYHWTAVLQNHAWANRFEPGLETGIRFTDDRSPVEVWSEQINLEARRDLHEFFGEEGRVW